MRTRLVASGLYGTVAGACSEARSVREIHAAHPEVNRAVVETIVGRLVEHQILHEERAAVPPAEMAMAAYGPWNPAAGFFHTSTKDVQFTGGLPTVEGLAARRGPAPAPLVRLPRGSIRLSTSAVGGEFPDVLLRRRTWRRFGRRPVTLAQLAQLLRFTAGAHHWLQLQSGARLQLRTSPSGGAMHPIDLYVVGRSIRGLAAGLYRYDSEHHGLVPLRRSKPRIERYLPGQPWYETASALVLFAASFGRTRRRYPYSRAYRAVLIEAGHLCQTFCLAATWLELAPFCSMALADSAIDGDLGLDGISQSVIYAAGVGTRGRDESACMVAPGTDPPKVIANPRFA